MQTTPVQAAETARGVPLLPPNLRVMDILGRIPQFGSVPADRRLLLTAEGALDPALPPVAAWAVFRIPVTAAGMFAGRRSASGDRGPAQPLPFADDTFEAICVYGALRQVVPQPGLLNKVQRMLRPAGQVVLIEPLGSFNFTTLPIGGPAQLLRRQLLQAGFQRVRALPEADNLLVVLADRDVAVAPKLTGIAARA